MSEEITYEDAKKAKETLLKWLEKNGVDEHENYNWYLRKSSEYMVWLALNSEYFLE